MEIYNTTPQKSKCGQKQLFQPKGDTDRLNEGGYHQESSNFNSRQVQSKVQLSMSLKEQAEDQVMATDIYFRLQTEIDVLLNRCGFKNPIRFPQFNIVASHQDIQGMLIDLEVMNSNLITFNKAAARAGVPAPVYEKNIECARYYAQFIPLLAAHPEGLVVAGVLSHLIKAFEAGKFTQLFDEELSERIMSKETKKKYTDVGTQSGIRGAMMASINTHNLLAASADQIDRNTREVLERYQSGKNQMKNELQGDCVYPGGWSAPRMNPPAPLASTNFIHDLKAKQLKHGQFH